MRPPDFDIYELIEDLKGTPSSIDVALPAEMIPEDLTTEDHEKIDAEIFQCDRCGWWCEQDENHNGDEICEDCSDEVS